MRHMRSSTDIVNLQLTMTASFVPPLLTLETRRPPSLQMTNSNGHLATTPKGGALGPPRTPVQPQTPAVEAHLPPLTPNPYPAMSGAEEQYARVEGVVVWEGAVETADGVARTIFRRSNGWIVVWRGEVPIGERVRLRERSRSPEPAYPRTPVQNPLLSLTASVTLREHPDISTAHRKGAPSIDTVSIRSEATIRTDGNDNEVGEEEDDDMADMEEIDLLGGLAGGGYET